MFPFLWLSPQVDLYTKKKLNVMSFWPSLPIRKFYNKQNPKSNIGKDSRLSSRNQTLIQVDFHSGICF